MRKIVCGLLLCAACAAQTVEGIVTDYTTGAGIPGVTVELVAARFKSPNDRLFAALEGKGVYTTLTDVQGRFRFDNVADGSYAARYTADRYEFEAFVPSHEDALQAFPVSAATGPVKLQARMVHMGRIAGRVMDGRGKPVPKARLDLIAPMLSFSTDTNEEGTFNLPVYPGAAYTLDVVPPLALKPPDPEPEGGRALGWTKTYYPGVARPESAAKINLPPGGDLLDIELKFQAVPTHALRGVLLNPDGTPAVKVPIVACQDAMVPRLRVTSGADGTFELPLVDGPSLLSATLQREDGALRAVQTVEMAGRDIEGVKLRLKAPIKVPLAIATEKVEGRSAAGSVQFSLVPVGGAGLYSLPRAGVAVANGAAPGERDLSLYPAAYRLFLAAAPRGYYLDAVRLGGAEIPAPDIDLTAGPLPLTLVFKANGGSLRGTVEKCAAGGVLLVPQDPAQRWQSSGREPRCDSNGRYEISDLRPGDYYAIAFQSSGSPFFTPPHFEDNWINQSARVTVKPGETTVLDLVAQAANSR